jgi:hypothetical protein
MKPAGILSALSLLLLLSPAAHPDAPKFETVDFAKVERRIEKEPKYVADPLYAHENLLFATIPKKGRKGVWFSMMWRGREKVAGGSSKTGYDNTVWGPSATKAPILRPTVEGPLGFAIWGGPRKPKLRIGRDNRLSFIVGNPGSGPDTLCYVTDEFLVPGKDRIFATVIATDRKGKRLTARSEIRDKPC